MVKAFLDTNIFIDIAYRKPQIRKTLHQQQVCISPLSVHILCYINKIKAPNTELNELLAQCKIIAFDSDLLHKAIVGPTTDLEDNIQLHSAAEAECDLFLTSDEQLLNMKFFGKTQVIHKLVPTST